MRRRERCNKSNLDEVKLVDIDEEGTFCYLLFRVFCAKYPNKDDITVVRGYSRYKFHSGLYEFIKTNLLPLHCEPLGGGMINFDPVGKVIHCFGTSAGFNQANHITTARLIKQAYPGYAVTAEKTGAKIMAETLAPNAEDNAMPSESPDIADEPEDVENTDDPTEALLEPALPKSASPSPPHAPSSPPILETIPEKNESEKTDGPQEVQQLSEPNKTSPFPIFIPVIRYLPVESEPVRVIASPPEKLSPTLSNVTQVSNNDPSEKKVTSKKRASIHSDNSLTKKKKKKCKKRSKSEDFSESITNELVKYDKDHISNSKKENSKHRKPFCEENSNHCRRPCFGEVEYDDDYPCGYCKRSCGESQPCSHCNRSCVQSQPCAQCNRSCVQSQPCSQCNRSCVQSQRCSNCNKSCVQSQSCSNCNRNCVKSQSCSQCNRSCEQSQSCSQCNRGCVQTQPCSICNRSCVQSQSCSQYNRSCEQSQPCSRCNRSCVQSQSECGVSAEACSSYGGWPQNSCTDIEEDEESDCRVCSHHSPGCYHSCDAIDEEDDTDDCCSQCAPDSYFVLPLRSSKFYLPGRCPYGDFI